MVSLDRIQDLLNMPSAIRTSPSDLPLGIDAGAVELRAVSFAYGDQQVLSDVNLTIEAGCLTAIVGPSGSGKSSLLRLIARLYEPSRGQVLIDGQPLLGTTLESLRAGLAVVPQRAFVFSGTVLENIRLADPAATIDAVRDACVAAAALPFIERLPGGFDTRLGRHGVSLSAGEVQRIAIARALLTRPKILLLDEPTAALDSVTEATIVNALVAMRGKMTMVFVGHRPEAVRNADHVVVLEGGRVVAEGTHADLLTESPTHKRLFGTPADAGAA
jgi:ATP-binding cassette subfamily B protein